MTDWIVREISENDRAEWARLREALWPGAFSEHDAETRKYFQSRTVTPIVFMAEADGRLVGFLEMDFRKSAIGCASSPVPAIEGWYVEPAWRGRGVGRSLVRVAEARARAEGYGEIASDTRLENTNGIAAHLALGYEQVERLVCFRKTLDR